MINDLKTRDFAAERKPGRPPATAPKHPEVEAVPDMTQRRVPSLVCPKCGRGMTPLLERWEANGTASCICQANGCRFSYTPAKVRVK